MKDEAGLTCVPIQASVQTHWGTNEKSHSHNLFIYLRKTRHETDLSPELASYWEGKLCIETVAWDGIKDKHDSGPPA